MAGGVVIRGAGRHESAAARDGDHLLDELRMRLLVGAPPPSAHGALPARAARALRLAAEVGAPSVPALDAAISAREHQVRRARALQVAAAQARVVAGGLAVLPVVAVLGVGKLLGRPLWRFYLTAPGAVVGAIGLGLAVVGLAIGLRLVRAATRGSTGGRSPIAGLLAAAVPATLLLGLRWGGLLAAALVVLLRGRPRRPPVAGADEVADLLASAMSSGLPAAAALRAVASVLPPHDAELRRAALALELGRAPSASPGLDRALAALHAATTWGAPAAPALRRVAADLREAELARALAAAERLPALLVFPTTLCLLPGCLLLVGAPLLATGLEAVTKGT